MTDKFRLSNGLSRTPSKNRSLSDSTPQLSPSPLFKEPRRSRDDHAIISTPGKSPPTAAATTADALFQQLSAHKEQLASVSRQELEPKDGYGPPSTVLPRHSRGLDFSRACTNLHHSTLADQSSPDSSPTITQKSMLIPSRRPSMHLSMQDSPRMSLGGFWASNPGLDRPFVPRSLGSANAFASDASSNSSDDDDDPMRQDDADDVAMSTPRSNRVDNNSGLTPFLGPRLSSSEGWMLNGSPINPFMLSRNERFTSVGSDIGPFRLEDGVARPSFLKRESTGGYFGSDVAMAGSLSRRESLSQGTTGLHITTSNESGDENSSGMPPGSGGVVRRPVTRRSNLLPKTKNFARIRAALQEESAPIDSEAKREAQVVHQVRANDVGVDKMQTNTAVSSPDLTPTTIPRLSTEGSEMSDIDPLGTRTEGEVPKAAPDIRRGSTHREFFPKLYNRMQTPPPPLFQSARSSSGVSEEMSTDSPHVATPPAPLSTVVPRASTEPKTENESSSNGMFQQPPLPSASEITKKIQNKRRRDEDFDAASIKRRAVSPGMSITGSPVTGQSPVSSNSGWWGQPKPNRDGAALPGEQRTGSSGNSGQATPSFGPKRVGLQGMSDTHDGIMKMSIE